MNLLKTLCEIPGVSGDEKRISDFVLNYVLKNKDQWLVQPEIIHGDPFQDCIILVFGEPRTAIYAHMDSIGFTTGYNKELIKVGGPSCEEGTILVGEDSQGAIQCEYLMIEHEDGPVRREYVFEREIDRGTNLSYQADWRETEDFVQCCYMDNRLGVWNALQVAETLQDGAIVFSCYEEHGGGTVGYLAEYLYTEHNVRQALISDITWVTEGVQHGEGVAISMRDSGIPRRQYLNRIIELAENSGIQFQLEVESAGGSDGTALQRSPFPIDWLFIGAPENHVHSPNEIVHKDDIRSMLEMYQYLMKHL